jgi:hypothetical protein
VGRSDGGKVQRPDGEQLVPPGDGSGFETAHPAADAGIEHQHRYAHAYFRNNDGQGHEAFHPRLERKPEPPQPQRNRRADDGGNYGAHDGDCDGVHEGLDQRDIVPGFLVVLQREAAPDDVAFAVVEAEGDELDDRCVEQHENDQAKADQPG